MNKTFFSNIVTLFDNHGNRGVNSRILCSLGYSEYSKIIQEDFRLKKRHYVLINLSAEILSIDLRLCTNLFSEDSKYIHFY